jgi:hypothetical protein
MIESKVPEQDEETATEESDEDERDPPMMQYGTSIKKGDQMIESPTKQLIAVQAKTKYDANLIINGKRARVQTNVLDFAEYNKPLFSLQAPKRTLAEFVYLKNEWVRENNETFPKHD